jgi:hypothetical protein
MTEIFGILVTVANDRAGEFMARVPWGDFLGTRPPVLVTLRRRFYSPCNKPVVQVSKQGPNDQGFMECVHFPIQRKVPVRISDGTEWIAVLTLQQL